MRQKRKTGRLSTSTTSTGPQRGTFPSCPHPTPPTNRHPMESVRALLCLFRLTARTLVSPLRGRGSVDGCELYCDGDYDAGCSHIGALPCWSTVPSSGSQNRLRKAFRLKTKLHVIYCCAGGITVGELRKLLPFFKPNACATLLLLAPQGVLYRAWGVLEHVANPARLRRIFTFSGYTDSSGTNCFVLHSILKFHVFPGRNLYDNTIIIR